MLKRLTERYDVASVRLQRGDPTQILEAVEAILPNGFVFHVLNHTPEQGEDLYCVLIDGRFVVSFELPRYEGAGPVEITVHEYDVFRRAIGQGRHRIFLEQAAEDARAILGADPSRVRNPTVGRTGNVILGPASETMS